MDQKHQVSLSSYRESKVPSAAVSKVVRSGNANVRERSTFGGTSWKPKRLELDAESLTIINLTSQKRTRIALRDITELDRTDLTDHSLGLKAKNKLFNFSFSSDPELYDWQDDIYRRCPLGNYSAPFDFVHKSHIGSDTVSGSFTDPNILPIYAEIVGQPSVSKTSPPAVVAPRSRPASGVPLNAVSKGSPSSGSTLLEGVFVIKQAGLLAGWLWKERWLTLTPQALIIHRRNTKTSAAAKSISLPSLTRIEPDAKRPKCLIVEFATSPNGPSSSSAPAPTDTVSILFRSDTDLYTWRDALYLRSALSSPIGQPTNFVHHVHVGFDPVSGFFTGLPAEWQAVVNPSLSSSTSGDKKARRQSRRKSAPLVPPTAA